MWSLSSLSTVTRLRAGLPRFDSRRGQELFVFVNASRPALVATHPSIQWVPAANSMGVKWPGREADHSPQSSAKVKNEWSYYFHTSICLQGVVLN
jgi:hypothetical protein